MLKNRRSTRSIKLIAAVLSLFMLFSATLIGCGNSNEAAKEGTTAVSTGTDSSETVSTVPAATQEPKEAVTLTMFGYGWVAAKVTGVQTDPTAKEIEKKLGIKIEYPYMSTTDADIWKQLDLLVASNDLPDVINFFNGNDTMKRINGAVKSSQLLQLDNLVETNCPTIMQESSFKSVLDYNKKILPDGKLWALPIGNGLPGLEPSPTVGNYLSWDLYKQLNYPKIDSDDDLLKVLSDMQKLAPETSDGQKVYGLGGWFSENQKWGDWPIFCMPYTEGYVVDQNYAYTWDILTNNILPKNPVTDADSAMWKTARFFNKAKQMGLLDPDSATQKYDKWVDKANNGRYLMVQQGWMRTDLKNAFEKNNIKGKGYVAIPPYSSAEGIVSDWADPIGASFIGISSKCKNPEKALQLIDFICTPDGSRLMHDGPEGLAWKYVDGKPVLTDEFIAEMKTMDMKDIGEKYGYGKYRRLAGYGFSQRSPKDGEYFELTMADSYMLSQLSDLEKDAINHYGVNSLRDIYVKNSKTTVYWTAYSNLLGEPPADIKANQSNLANFTYKNLFKAIYADSDSAFEAAKAKMMKDAQQYKTDDILKWYTDRYTELKKEIDPIVETAKSNMPK